MKKTDVAMIIFIASVSILVAYFVGNSIFSSVITKGEKVKVIDPISSTVEAPSPLIFNSDAINPSVQVQITGSGGTTTTNTQTGTQ